MKNRNGYIIISEESIYGKGADLDLLQLVFAQFLPINISIEDFPNRQRVYCGFSKHFDEIAEGIVPPFYEIVIGFNKNEDTGEVLVAVNFKRI